FVNSAMREQYGVDSMPETAENVADDFSINREDQDRFALASQEKYTAAHEKGFFKEEIVPITVPQRRADPIIFDTDEHPRTTSLEALANLRAIVRPDGTITAGNASGVNDGAAVALLANQKMVE